MIAGTSTGRFFTISVVAVLGLCAFISIPLARATSSAEQTDVSALSAVSGGGEQRLGTGLSGSVAALAMKFKENDTASMEVNGFPYAILNECLDSSYLNCAQPAAFNYHNDPAYFSYVSHVGDDIVVSIYKDASAIDYDNTPYTLNPALYYSISFFIFPNSGTGYVYGSPTNTSYPNGQLLTGGVADANVANAAFRLCDTTTCDLTPPPPPPPPPDTTPPTLAQVAAIPASTSTTPTYSFTSTESGAVTYAGSCGNGSLATAATGTNATTFGPLAPATYSNCTIVVTDAANNASAPLAITPFTIQAPPPPPPPPPPSQVTVTLSASADTYVRKGASNTNEGASPIIRIRAAGDNRGLVRFNQADIAAAIGTGTLVSATLEMSIEEAKNNWGKTGREIGVHRLLSDWTEGNGKNGELPGNQSFRGTGIGATWDCAKDQNITNQKSDCATIDDWEMRLKNNQPFGAPWVEQKTDGFFVQKRQEGVIDFTVTADVQAYLGGASNYGWIIRKEEENKAGYVSFQSKESGGVAPALILVVNR